MICKNRLAYPAFMWEAAIKFVQSLQILAGNSVAGTVCISAVCMLGFAYKTKTTFGKGCVQI